MREPQNQPLYEDNDTPSVVMFNASDQKPFNILPPLPPMSVANSEMSLSTQRFSNPGLTPDSRKEDHLVRHVDAPMDTASSAVEPHTLRVCCKNTTSLYCCYS